MIQFTVNDLIFAAFQGKEENVESLIREHKISPSAKDESGSTAAHSAAQNNKVNILRLLHDKFSVDFSSLRDDLGDTALHEAAREGHLECVKFFVEVAKLDPTTSSGAMGNTPVHSAAAFDQVEILKYFSEHSGVWRFDDLKNDEQETPLALAKGLKATRSVEFFGRMD
jgi:ankyrin repeat protein